MLLVSYGRRTAASLGVVDGDDVYPVVDLCRSCDGVEVWGQSMLVTIQHWAHAGPHLLEALSNVRENYTGPRLTFAEAGLLAPIPTPIRDPMCVAGNYQAHIDRAQARTGIPLNQRRKAFFFTKATETVIGPFDDIQYDPTLTSQVDYELELGVVIGQRGRDITEDQAMDFVFGFTVVNDVSARDLQIVQPQADFFRGKGLDTFMPTGPGIVPKDHVADYTALEMRLYVNDELRQEGTPALMIRSVPALIAELSRGITLLPGDIIATGTPSGTAMEMAEPQYLEDGDVVRGHIDGIGTIENRVVAAVAT